MAGGEPGVVRPFFCYPSSCSGPVVLYAAFVRGFRDQLLRIAVGGLFSCPAHSAAPGTGRRDGCRGYQGRVQRWKSALSRTVFVIVCAAACLEHCHRRGHGDRPGRDLRAYCPAARLYTRSRHYADVRRAAAGIAVGSGASICVPCALPDGRRGRSAGVQPSWSRRYCSAAWPDRRLPALVSFCRCAGQCVVSPLAWFIPGRTGRLSVRQHSDSCRRSHLAWAAELI